MWVLAPRYDISHALKDDLSMAVHDYLSIANTIVGLISFHSTAPSHLRKFSCKILRNGSVPRHFSGPKPLSAFARLPVPSLFSRFRQPTCQDKRPAVRCCPSHRAEQTSPSSPPLAFLSMSLLMHEANSALLAFTWRTLGIILSICPTRTCRCPCLHSQYATSCRCLVAQTIDRPLRSLLEDFFGLCFRGTRVLIKRGDGSSYLNTKRRTKFA